MAGLSGFIAALKTRLVTPDYSNSIKMVLLK